MFLEPLRSWRRAKACRNWPRTTGRVISAKVEVNDMEHTTTYSPRIEYEYQACGRAWTNDRISFEVIRSGSEQQEFHDRAFQKPKRCGMAIRFDASRLA